MIELYPQSDKDQFVITSHAEKYYENSSSVPNCQICNKKVAYHESNPGYIEFACHGNILRFHFLDGLLAKVEELQE